MQSFKLVAFALIAIFSISLTAHAELRAGAAVINVNPNRMPTWINGGMTGRQTSDIKTDVNARAIVLADDDTEIAIVVVDSCMMGRPLLDEAKKLAAKATSIPAANMLISATHTHSAPASMGCLGTDPDPFYQRHLVKKLAEAIATAQKNLEPAKAGWSSTDAADFTALRRWVFRPDSVREDPFGNRTARASMHPGFLPETATGETGPEDPELGIVAFQALDGRPIAVMGNFSMHYYGDKAISADYFGLFSEGLKQRIAPNTPEGLPEFVGLMSHAPSGDIYLRDYAKPEPKEKPHTIESYAEGLVDLAVKAYEKIEFEADLPLAMAESRMTLNYRVPDKQRLEWARGMVAKFENGMPRNGPEVYAREAIMLHERQKTEVVNQAITLGELGLSTTPCETYAITALKIKAMSPLKKNFVIELANGGDGYIPPPEQHVLGGYNTWPARSAGLEVQAEPKMVESMLKMLESLSGRDRLVPVPEHGNYAQYLARLKPTAWWRLDEFGGRLAEDESGNHNDGYYEDGVVFYLEGPDLPSTDEVNRCAHFAGGRMTARLRDIGDTYSVSLRIWNGMPNGSRDVLGWMLSRDRDHSLTTDGDHLGIDKDGHLIFQHGDDPKTRVTGKTVVPRWTWTTITLIRDGENVTVRVNGKPDITTKSPADFPKDFDQWFVGGRSDDSDNWEGRLDEVAVFDRRLTDEEIVNVAK
jgi:hypothetical protein